MKLLVAVAVLAGNSPFVISILACARRNLDGARCHVRSLNRLKRNIPAMRAYVYCSPLKSYLFPFATGDQPHVKMLFKNRNRHLKLGYILLQSQGSQHVLSLCTNDAKLRSIIIHLFSIRTIIIR